MNLTIKRKLVIFFEVLFAKSGHGHAAQEKQLSTFIAGYNAGRKDAGLECTKAIGYAKYKCADKAEQVAHSLTGDDLLKNIHRAVINT